MNPLPGWRAAFRIARRDAVRAKGRSALVVAMIALPVLGVTAADLTYRSALPTKAEELTGQLGSADARFSATGLGPMKLQQMPDGVNWGTPTAPRTRPPNSRRSRSTCPRPCPRARAISPSAACPRQ